MRLVDRIVTYNNIGKNSSHNWYILSLIEEESLQQHVPPLSIKN